MSSKIFLKTSRWWIWCFFTANDLQCSLRWYLGGTAWMAIRMHARLKGFDLIVKSRFLRHQYNAHYFLWPAMFERCVLSELPHKRTILAPSCCLSDWSGQIYCSSDNIQLMYLFIPPPVAYFHRLVDMIISITKCLCWSIRHMFPERKLLHVELNAFNKKVVE